MSFQVVVVPEDPTYNGYILRPLAKRLLEACGKPKARIHVVTSPRLQGYSHAKALLLDKIIDRYAHRDLILFLPDADGRDRSDEFRAMEQQAVDCNVKLLCCAAVQEVETWLLAGHVERLGASWAEVRPEVSVKERFFNRFIAKYGDPRRPGEGREPLMKQTLANYHGLLQRCPELAGLQQRIEQLLAGGAG